MAESIPVSDSFSLDRIYTGSRQRRDLAKSSLKPVKAIDTETWKGDIFLIADSDGNYLDDISINSVIQFLFSKRYQNTWNFCYNLGYDAEVILKLLDEKLKVYKRSNDLKFRFDDYKISYIPDKILRITKGHHSVSFYDIAQYYHTSLENAYESNIEKLPDWYKQFKVKRNQLSPRYYSRNRKKVREYCITDCIHTKKLAEHWVSNFYYAFYFYVQKWISSGYCAEKVLINNRIEIPRFNETPYDVQKMAWSVVDHGGRFEITKRGLIGKTFLYDINSAYPYALTQIPDITKGRWVKGKSIHKDAKLGFFRILADIPISKHICPFPFKKGHRIFFPSGEFETIVTLHELQSCEDSSFYKILDSWQFIPEPETYPYRDFISNLYQKRLKLKQEDNPIQLPLKIILNSIYGKTGQTVNNKIGNLFNPVIFVTITGMIRGLLYKFVMENHIEFDTVAFATDSILTTKKLDYDSTKLGEFSFDNMADDCYLLQNGYYRMNGKWKNRGIASMSGKTIEHLDTIQRNGKLFLKIQEYRNTRLRSGIILNRVSDIGNIKPAFRWIDPNADKKRFWLGEISKIDDTKNDSMPLLLNHMTKE